MNESTSEKILRFNDYFKESIEDLVPEDGKKDQMLFQRIVLMTIIDYLSFNLTTGEQKKHGGDNKARFITSISNVWSNAKKVSTTHIGKALQKGDFHQKNPDFDAINEFIEKNIRQKFQIITPTLRAKKIPFDCDPHFDDLIKIWPRDNNKSADNFKKLNGNSIYEFRHGNIFYFYRNLLIHQHMDPILPLLFRVHSSDPYYQKRAYFTENGILYDDEWEIYYPINFIKKLSLDLLSATVTYHTNNNTSPFKGRCDMRYLINGLSD